MLVWLFSFVLASPSCKERDASGKYKVKNFLAIEKFETKTSGLQVRSDTHCVTDLIRWNTFQSKINACDLYIDITSTQSKPSTCIGYIYFFNDHTIPYIDQ